MAVVVAAQLLGQIVSMTDPGDVENDATLAPQGTINILAANGQQYSFVIAEPVAASVIAQLAVGNCTLTISQGAGTLNVAVTQ